MDLYIGSYELSEKFNLEHRLVIRLIKKHELFLSEIGNIEPRFLKASISENEGGRPISDYILNANQVYFIVMLMPNHGYLLKLKKRIAKSMIENRKSQAKMFLQEIRSIKTEKRHGHVYVIQTSDGIIKIGRSTIPEKRIDSLKTQGNLKIVKKYVSKKTDAYYEIETKAHNAFEDERTKGEWFNSSFENAVEFIKNELNKRLSLVVN